MMARFRNAVEEMSDTDKGERVASVLAMAYCSDFNDNLPRSKRKKDKFGLM